MRSGAKRQCFSVAGVTGCEVDFVSFAAACVESPMTASERGPVALSDRLTRPDLPGQHGKRSPARRFIASRSPGVRASASPGGMGFSVQPKDQRGNVGSSPVVTATWLISASRESGTATSMRAHPRTGRHR